MRRIENQPISYLCTLLPKFKDDLQEYILCNIAARLYSIGITDDEHYSNFINHELKVHDYRLEENDFIYTKCDATSFIKFYFKYIKSGNYHRIMFSELLLFSNCKAVLMKECKRLNRMIEKDSNNRYLYETFIDLFQEEVNKERPDVYDYLAEINGAQYPNPNATQEFLISELNKLDYVTNQLQLSFMEEESDVNYFDPYLIDIFKNVNKQRCRILPYYPPKK